MLQRIALFTALCITFFGAFPQNAHAYLDPGAASFILQGLAAALVAIGGAWYAFKAKIKNFFAKRTEDK